VAAVDAGPIQAIYAPIVAETAISFELEPPDVEAIERRIRETLPSLPWLVADGSDGVAGYAYATPHRVRAAYRWSVDVSVYVGAAERGRGIGRALYRSLFAVLRLLGYVNVYAVITLPNPASVRLHEALGFEPIGVFRGVGYKLERWHDTGHWELLLAPRPECPETPRPLAALVGTAELEEALAAGWREPGRRAGAASHR